MEKLVKVFGKAFPKASGNIAFKKATPENFYVPISELFSKIQQGMSGRPAARDFMLDGRRACVLCSWGE
ncbi:hypothetical protein RAA17_11465 [Komagataeibacter rhaeticus]|nr:hypothetical protein [Komagataeibacter rhaeticus]